MSRNLTQPEEVDFVMKEKERDEMTVTKQITNGMAFANVTPKSWDTGYLPPYRAAYMRDHSLDLRK